MHEAARLQDDLRRAEIEPFGWVINASLATSESTHPTLRARAAAEQRHIEQVKELSDGGVWLVGWQPQAPIGVDALLAMTRGRALPTS